MNPSSFFNSISLFGIPGNLNFESILIELLIFAFVAILLSALIAGLSRSSSKVFKVLLVLFFLSEVILQLTGLVNLLQLFSELLGGVPL